MRLSMSPHDSADPSPRTASPRIAIVGAGFAGIAMAIRLRQAGIESFTIYEQADGVGGTWRANTYPGAACDIP
jgi:cation diffusion facilitator CzcD-associated flavoprotein CzcO